MMDVLSFPGDAYASNDDEEEVSLPPDNERTLFCPNGEESTNSKEKNKDKDEYKRPAEDRGTRRHRIRLSDALCQAVERNAAVPTIESKDALAPRR